MITASRIDALRSAGIAWASWLCIGFCLTVLLAAALPSLVGMHGYTVRSGSMEPSIGTGDVVVTSEIRPDEARVGDIVTFRDPDGSGELITHRVRAVRPQNGALSFVTRGDANNAAERWSVEPGGSIGIVRYRIPELGRLVVHANSGAGRLLLVVLPALGLCALGLVRIWAPHRLQAQGTR